MLTKQTIKKEVFFVALLVLFGLVVAGGVEGANCGIGYGNCSCGDTLMTSYNLSVNDSVTTGSCTSNGLNIGAQGIVLDCKGRQISAWDYYGINNIGYDGVVIKNCIINRFRRGIYIDSASNNSIINNTIKGETDGYSYTVHDSGRGIGIYLSNVNNTYVIRNNISETAKSEFDQGACTILGPPFVHMMGIEMGSSSNNIIRDNVFDNIKSEATGWCGGYAWSYGLYLDSSANNSIYNNTFDTTQAVASGYSSTEYAWSYGLLLNASQDNNISNNYVLKTTASAGVTKEAYGAYFDSSSSNLLFNDYFNNTHSSVIADLCILSSTQINIYNHSSIEKYVFSDAGLVFNDVEEGEIVFLNTSITESGTDLSSDIIINDNLIAVDSAAQPGFNQSADLTLYNIFDGMRILRNGVECPSNICTLLSPTLSGTVVFNVTGFTNYSIDEVGCGDTITYNVNLSGNLKNSTGGSTCSGDGLIIGADDVVVDCAGHSITGSGSSYGINNTGFDNVTIKNCVIQNFTNGIYFDGSDSSRIIDNDVTNNVLDDIAIYSSSLINITLSSAGLLVDNSSIVNYHFDSVQLEFNNSYGKIEYVPSITESGTNLSSDISISDNLIFVDSSKTGFNQSAELSLYSLTFNDPKLRKNGLPCASPDCNLLSYSLIMELNMAE